MRKNTHPPRWVTWILETFCDPYLLEGIQGDLLEVFRENVELKGLKKARWIYGIQSIGFLRITFKKKRKTITPMKAIWINYLLTAFRSLKKQKTLFAINLTGLVLAISCSLFALVYINDEFQFDRLHSKSDQTYRLYKRYINVAEDIDRLTYETSGMMGPTMVEEYPEIENHLRVCPWWDNIILSYQETNISTEKMYFADSNFFSFFDFEVLAGDRTSFLNAPSSIVLTESLAKKIFNEEDPIGKTLIGLRYEDYTVTGIVKDPPRHSSIQFEAIISWSTTIPGVGPLSMTWMNNWLAQGVFTFVQLAKDANPVEVEAKLPEMMNRHFKERADQYFLKLQPLERMYLFSDQITRARGMKTGSITFVYILGFSALMIFLIAGINYVNISLSRATKTRTEVGIRKVMGSTKRQLVGRFISETFIQSFIASVLALGLVILLLPEANALSNKELPVSSFFQPLSIFSLAGFIILTSIIVGIYPSLVLSAPPVSSILKSQGSTSGAGWFRKSLLIVQYSISILLIICTLVVIRQIQYLENKPLGFDKEQIIVIDVGNEVSDKSHLLEEKLLSHPNILLTSTTRSSVGNGSYTTTVVPEGYEDELNTRVFGVDQEFFETYGIKLLEGRTFLKGSSADSGNLVINRALADFMGWENPIGKHIRTSDDGPPMPVIGVVDDFHSFSPAEWTIEPMVIYLDLNAKWHTSVRIGNGDLKSTIDHIQKSWDELAGRTPLDFFFIDDWFNQQYKKERRLLSISTVYSIISILLCGLGLYGLTALLLQQRSKEISIRKVLGASVTGIAKMMNSQFLIIIIISLSIAIPIAYFLLTDWLDQFAYKQSLDVFPFVLSAGLTMIISLIIVSGLTIKVANMNPCKNLTSE